MNESASGEPKKTSPPLKRAEMGDGENTQRDAGVPVEVSEKSRRVHERRKMLEKAMVRDERRPERKGTTMVPDRQTDREQKTVEREKLWCAEKGTPAHRHGYTHEHSHTTLRITGISLLTH